MKKETESKQLLIATLRATPFAPINIEYNTLQDLVQSVWEVIYDLDNGAEFAITLADGTSFPWNRTFADLCFYMGLLGVDEFIDACLNEHEIEKDQEKPFKATVQITAKSSIKVEYDTLEDLVESIWESLFEIPEVDYDFEITATLANGSVFHWNHGYAHYCFAKSRISIEQFIDSCNKVVEKKEGATL